VSFAPFLFRESSLECPLARTRPADPASLTKATFSAGSAPGPMPPVRVGWS
jgi:hypothetical protein